MTPSICIVVQGNEAPSFTNQTLRDFEVLRNRSESEALDQSPAKLFLWMTGAHELRPHALEECFWGLQAAEWVTWSDTGAAPPPSIEQCAGPLGVTRNTLARPESQRTGTVCSLPWRCRLPADRRAKRTIAPGLAVVDQSPAVHHDLPVSPASTEATSPTPAGVRGHLENAELLSLNAWLRHPIRSATRLLPLRLKERVNQWAARPVFDLSFYLQFQPRTVLIDGAMIRHFEYEAQPASDGRRRIALCTPHLGYGGAESVLLEIARQFDPGRFELFLVATQSTDSRLAAEWHQVADHVYDLRQFLPVERIAGALYSLAVNWQWDGMVVQNSALAYSPLPAIAERLPNLRVIDVLHNIDADWDFFSATLDVTEHIDRRIVISEAGRRRLIDMAVDEETIRLIRNGIDLDIFNSGAQTSGRLHQELKLAPDTRIILFAAHLIKRKRPLLLLEIDRELQRNPPAVPYHFVIAGDGPQHSELLSKLQCGDRGRCFTLLGHVDQVAPLLADTAVLIVPSTEEGLPLSIIEALAMQVPVISSRVGAIDEAVTRACGILIENDGEEATAFADALRGLLANDTQRKAMGEAGRVLVEQHYDLRRAQSDYLQLINDLFPISSKEAEHIVLDVR